MRRSPPRERRASFRFPFYPDRLCLGDKKKEDWTGARTGNRERRKCGKATDGERRGGDDDDGAERETRGSMCRCALLLVCSATPREGAKRPAAAGRRRWTGVP
jgi:hypothetical protein